MPYVNIKTGDSLYICAHEYLREQQDYVWSLLLATVDLYTNVNLIAQSV
jgi:hypothetical protein